MTYRLGSSKLADFFRALRELADSHFPAIERLTRDFPEARGVLEPVEMVRLFRAHCFRVARLEDGIPDWCARGPEVAHGES